MRCFKHPLSLSRALRLMTRTVPALACLAVGARGAQAQMLGDLGNHSALTSSLVQTLSQKRHLRASTDPYMALIENSDPYYRLHSMTISASMHKSTAYASSPVWMSTVPPSIVTTGASNQGGLAALALQSGITRASQFQGPATLPKQREFAVRSAQIGSSIAGATLPGMSASSTLTGCLLAAPSSAMPSVASSCR